jgi:hypothetical protein
VKDRPEDARYLITPIFREPLEAILHIVDRLKISTGDQVAYSLTTGKLDRLDIRFEKQRDSSDYRGWDTGSLPGDLNDPLCPLSSLCSLCFARFPRNIPGTQDEEACLMDDILIPIPIDLKSLKPQS